MTKEFLKFVQSGSSYLMWLFFDPSKFKHIERKKIKKILVINLGFIGDLLATTPMIAALEKKFGKVDVLIRPNMEEVLTLNPNIRKILTYHNFNESLERIKKEKYDLAVIVWPASLELSRLASDAGIPYRIGATQTGLLEGKGYFLTRKVKPSFYTKHKVEENLDIARLVNADIKSPRIEFYVSKKDEDFIKNLLKKNKVKGFVVLHPGKRGRFYAEYSWPLENFARVADYLIEKYKLHIVITGSKGEENIADEILKNLKHKNKDKIVIATGKLTIKQFGVLLRKAKLLISIDTAAVHIASAFDIPMVVLNVKYPKIWHPWLPKEKYKILQSPDIEEVVKATQIFLKK